MKTKNIFIKTFGCQMNEYESNRILDTVKEIGFFKTENLNDTNCFLYCLVHFGLFADPRSWLTVILLPTLFLQGRCKNDMDFRIDVN